MAGVGTAGTSLVEAYVMRSIHKEKLKKQADAARMVAAEDDEQEIPNGCFFWGSKKGHSAKVSSAIDSDRKLKADEKWDSKS